MEPGTVILTGCAGFIGCKVAELLLQAGHLVVGIDNLNDAYDIRLKQWRLKQILHHPGFRFHQLDISDRAALSGPFKAACESHGRGPIAVINLAARAGVRQSVVGAELLVLFMGLICVVQMIRETAPGARPFGPSLIRNHFAGAGGTRDTDSENGNDNSPGRTVSDTEQQRIKTIIARLAQPEPLPDLSLLCPDRRELISILLNIRKGVKSPYSVVMREAAELRHIDVRHLVRKAETLLASFHLTSKTDYYAILELHQHASAEEIHERWIEKMRVFHPDNFEDPTGWIAEQSWSLNEAYAVLKDPEKRRAYNAGRNAQMRSGLRTAGATDVPAPARATRSALPSGTQWRWTRATAVIAIVIASLIVALLLWSF